MDLAALGDFDAVARHGGFGPASRATGRPKASLSRRVQALEAQLGVRLFERGGRTLRLTEEGAALHARTSPLVAELGGIGAELADTSGRPRGRLRVSVPAMAATLPGFGALAARFVAAHPEVRLEIVVEDRFVDPVGDDYDLIVRANPEPGSALVGQLLSRDEVVIAAAPALAMPAAGGDSVQVSAVTQLSAPGGETWRLLVEGGIRDLVPIPVLRVSSLAILREAVVAGAGAGAFPRGRIAAELADGRLFEWGRLEGRRVEVWALHPSRRLVGVKVRLFIEMLRDFYASGG